MVILRENKKYILTFGVDPDLGQFAVIANADINALNFFIKNNNEQEMFNYLLQHVIDYKLNCKLEELHQIGYRYGFDVKTIMLEELTKILPLN